MPYFVEVILPLNLAKTFTYSVSKQEFEAIRPGMRIAVPFGKNKIYTALSVAFHENPPQLYEAKPIHQILDEQPVVTPHQLQHWKWIASYYMCAIGDVYRSAMPSALILESETMIQQNTEFTVDAKELSDDEFLIYQALQQQSSLTVQEITSVLGKKNIFPILRKMMQRNLVLLV